jgi:hypothetical protein
MIRYGGIACICHDNLLPQSHVVLSDDAGLPRPSIYTPGGNELETHLSRASVRSNEHEYLRTKFGRGSWSGRL